MKTSSGDGALRNRIDQTHHDFREGHSEAIRLVIRGFLQAKIDTPEPIQTVRIEFVEKPGAEKEKRTSDESAKAQDMSRENSLDRRIESARAAAPDTDLLDADAHTSSPQANTACRYCGSPHDRIAAGTWRFPPDCTTYKGRRIAHEAGQHR